MTPIMSTNIYSRPINPPTLWTIFPAAYQNHIRRLIDRNNIFFFAFDWITDGSYSVVKDKDAILNRLKCYINYNDRVLDKIWSEAQNAEKKDSLGPEWRSPTLDRWLTIDYHIGGHTPDDIKLFLAEQNISELEDDPTELGMHT